MHEIYLSSPMMLNSLFAAPLLDLSADITMLVSMTILGAIMVLYTIPLIWQEFLLECLTNYSF